MSQEPLPGFESPQAPIDDQAARVRERRLGNVNPLSRICPGLLVLSCFVTFYKVFEGNADVFDSVATVGSVVLFVLYRRRSPHAVSFLLWTTLPVFPISFGLAALGVVGERPTALTLVIASAFWLGLLIYSWRLRRDYAAYIEASAAPVDR